ncbi:hypothetical protein O3G_MSEX001979 [Manduca sexta]|uniref:Uncharacterized protein n=1 Tax=Manduca sexta TaxID=7130 RepID=A0A921YM33_MANSE|nr:hypothetical protein O3G_MSEX001979 [Manduca sexta]
MATLVKEKRKEKKKSKDKRSRTEIVDDTPEIPSISKESTLEENISTLKSEEQILESKVEVADTPSKFVSKAKKLKVHIENESEASEVLMCSSDISNIEKSEQILDNESDVQNIDKGVSTTTDLEIGYKNLTSKLKSMAISQITEVSEERKKELEDPEAYLKHPENTNTQKSKETSSELLEIGTPAVDTKTSESLEDVQPSAPVLEEVPQVKETPQVICEIEVAQPVEPKTQCMSIQDAVRLFGGKEIAEMQAMSEREEALVENGPVIGPDHPLVDLLSTFRSSLIAVERERNELTVKVKDEEKSRNALWKIEKRNINISEPCLCGASVYIKAIYEHAELLKEKLPVAKMRLESLLRDVQDSYCHHQHAALLAHCQIEELILETIRGSKAEIRNALSLILQALRLSDTAPASLASALQRWACALAGALLDASDVRQLLFLIHHLFRQSHSVKWASRYIRLNVEDSGEAARVIALLEILLARPKPQLDTAVECTEGENYYSLYGVSLSGILNCWLLKNQSYTKVSETEEVWEEVDKHGSGGAVSDGTLRERDLLALLYAFPLRDLVSRLLLFTHVDVSQAQAESWGGCAGARGVVRACCGVRVLLLALSRAALAHARYARLQQALRTLANAALHALAGLHHCSREFYTEELKGKIIAELEACFTAGFLLFGTEELDSLPASLLADDTAMDYCVTLGLALHDKSPRHVESLSIDLPVGSCEMRVRMVAQAAIDRAYDHQLARTVLDFLFTTCLKSKSSQCKSGCVTSARASLPRLLRAHPYLYTIALHTLADLHHTDPIEPWAVTALNVGVWRPTSGELRALLDDWLLRCEHLIQHLLLNLDYTPHTGVSLESQLIVGRWLCGWVSGGEARWRVLRALRLHRHHAHAHAHDVPPPDPPPQHQDMFGTAHALLATAWGHCIPLICSEGVCALRRLSAVRPRDAVHCAAPLMAVMAQSPESVSYTPLFSEVLSTLLSSGPSLVQRALGRGCVSGADLLLRVILHHVEGEQYTPGLLQAWAHALFGKNIVNSASSAQGLVLLDVAALATRDWATMDAHATALVQAASARRHAALLRAVQAQRRAAAKIHVDNALHQIDARMSSEELTIYRSASAASAAPLHHPAHLTLWRLFMHLYLERAPGEPNESEPIGPLFFSGIIKSRTIAQIKKRLLETATHHHNEAERLKVEQNTSIESTSTITKEKSPKRSDDSLFPSLTIIDFTGEPIESDSDSDVEDEDVKKEDKNKYVKTDDVKRKQHNLITYHIGAEKMVREYLRWLEEGDKVRALQHHADIARFIPEQALEAAWQVALARSRPSPVDLDSPTTPPAVMEQPEPSTPFKDAVKAILKIRDRSQKKSRRTTIKSPIEDSNIKDSRTLFSIVDKHLKDIQSLAQDWSSDVSQISTLDCKLWELVSGLRVRRSLPTVKRQCANKCKPITIIIPHEEWCISTAAENGIRENRRGVRDSATAALVAERLWRCTGVVESCTLARQALNDTMQQLAECWISRDGHVVVELVSRWSRGGGGGSEAQLAQCASLVAPRLLSPVHWSHVYITVLKAPLPEHLLFSCLSKFEMGRWSGTITQSERHDILDALGAAAVRWGASPTQLQRVALELVGVHAAALLDGREFVSHVRRCTRASQLRTLPPDHWLHVVRAADSCLDTVPFDQMGHMLRELGTAWWSARGERSVRAGEAAAPYAPYAPHLAELMYVLTRALVRAAAAHSYDVERVAQYGWGAACEMWSPWVMPYSSPSLLPVSDDVDHYTPMVARFIDALLHIIEEYRGSEISVLQQAWVWCASTCACALTGTSQEARAEAPLLLQQAARLPWTTHQWCRGDTLNTALQMSNADGVLQAWCCQTWRYTLANTWMHPGAEDSSETGLKSRLVRLLYLFTGTSLPHYPETFEEATYLPWWKLPDHSLEQGLEYYFSLHSETARPYHEDLQYNVVLHAAGLRVSRVSAAHAARRREARAACVSRVTRAAAQPALAPHAPAHCRRLLLDITDVAPHLESSEGETEDLLSRAIVIMCIEPTATAALPVWEQWIRSTNPRMVRVADGG